MCFGTPFGISHGNRFSFPTGIFWVFNRGFDRLFDRGLNRHFPVVFPVISPVNSSWLSSGFSTGFSTDQSPGRFNGRFPDIDHVPELFWNLFSESNRLRNLQHPMHVEKRLHATPRKPAPRLVMSKWCREKR